MKFLVPPLTSPNYKTSRGPPFGSHEIHTPDKIVRTIFSCRALCQDFAAWWRLAKPLVTTLWTSELSAWCARPKILPRKLKGTTQQWAGDLTATLSLRVITSTQGKKRLELYNHFSIYFTWKNICPIFGEYFFTNEQRSTKKNVAISDHAVLLGLVLRPNEFFYPFHFQNPHGVALQ